jgi:hypothetical protein
MPIGQTVYCPWGATLNLLDGSRVSTWTPKGSELREQPR